MNKKIKIISLSILSLLILAYLIFTYMEPNKKSLNTDSTPTKNSSKNLMTDEKDSDKLKSINKNSTNNINQDNNNSLKISQTKEAENRQLRQLNDPENEVASIESVFIIEGMGVDMKFLDGMKDGEIFNLSLDSLEKASQKNEQALQNRSNYSNLMARQAEKYMQNHQNSNINIDDIQCGLSSCLAVMSGSSEEDWKAYFNTFLESGTENSIYTSNDVAFTDEAGNTLHRLFFSIDENINGIIIPPKD